MHEAIRSVVAALFAIAAYHLFGVLGVVIAVVIVAAVGYLVGRSQKRVPRPVEKPE